MVILLDHVYLRHPSVDILADISANYQPPLSTEYQSTFQPSIGRHIGRQLTDTWPIVAVDIGQLSVGWYIDRDSADMPTDTWPIVASVDRTSVHISIEYRPICRPTLGRYVGWYTSQRDTRYATDISTDTWQYVDWVSANMSTEYRPICLLSISQYVDQRVP